MTYEVRIKYNDSGLERAIDWIEAEEGYTAEQYIADSLENMGAAWCEQFDRGEISLRALPQTKALFIDGARDGYHPTQISETMTVGELIAMLSYYDDNTPIYIQNDNGYTYGGITDWTISEGTFDDEHVDLGR